MKGVGDVGVRRGVLRNRSSASKGPGGMRRLGSSEQIGLVAAELGVGLTQAGGGKPDTHPTY